MSTRKIMACFSFALLTSTVAMAQSKLAEEADAEFKAGRYYSAIELYKKAYTVEKKASEKALLIFRVGECYRTLGDAQQSEVWYEKANKAQYPDPITYLYLAEAQQEQGKYAEAIVAYNKYKEKNPGDMRAEAGVAACQQAQTWKDSPSRYSVDPEVMLNSPQYDFGPGYADKKNEDVVFASSRQAATGTETDGISGESYFDLFMSRRDKLGKWSEPVKLPPVICTDANESNPVFNTKRTVMYFTRCPHVKNEVHGCDIWMSKKVGNDYSEPVMLPLKPGGGDNKKDSTVIVIQHPAMSADESMLVFSANLPGGKGQDDIWRFYQPDLLFALQGTVFDKVTNLPIPGATVEVAGTDGSTFSAMTDDNGGFNFAEKGKDGRYINENTTYTIKASAPEYLVVNDQITTVGLEESTTFVKEYFLQPARKDVVIKLPEVQYDLGKFELRPEGKDSLETLYLTMMENPTIIIELAAHTDSRDTDKRNMVLSQNRAQSCVNYLVSKGIEPARMVAKGYGETMLRISDAEIAKMPTTAEKEAAHQQNRRTEFRVLSFDFVPTQTPQTPAPNN